MISEIPFFGGLTILGRNGISVFSIFLLIGFLSATALLRRELARKNLQSELADPILMITLVSSIIGSKVFYIWEIWDKIWIQEIGFGDTFQRVFFSWSGMSHVGGYGLWPTLLSGGGLVFYGGLVFAFIAVIWYLRKKKVNVWAYGDSILLMMSLGYGFGRLGCFVSGDGCFGHAAAVDIPFITWVFGPADGLCPSDPNLAWKYPLVCTYGIRVWNTPILEAGVSFAFFAVGMAKLRFMNFRPGMIVALMLIVNGCTRIFVEFFRVNDALIAFLKPPSVIVDGVERPLSHFASYENLMNLSQGSISSERVFYEHWHWYGITQSQLIALILVIISVIWIYKGRLYERESMESSASQPPHPANPETPVTSLNPKLDQSRKFTGGQKRGAKPSKRKKRISRK